MNRHTLTAALVAILAVSAAARADNVDLVTLPPRDGVQLTIYNSEDITLVKETRSVTVKKGLNELQFSWANTLIDPTSVRLRVLEHADEIEIAHTVFPGEKPQHLIWHIDSQYEGQVKLQVTYFISGLTWSMDYVAIADPQLEAMNFRGYVRVYNNSGEQYEDAEVRLIVGTINLVEKIAELARRRGIEVPKSTSVSGRELKRHAYHERILEAEEADEGGAGEDLKQIIKEGLSEYFMFTVEGTETIPNGWSKRMQAVEADGVPFDIVYRMRDYQYGPQPVRFFIWGNDVEHKLGETPLPDGRVMLFRDNGADGLALLGQQQIRYVPITDDIEINTGPDDLVVCESRRMDTERLNFHFSRNGRGDEYVDGWDEKTRWVQTVRNYRDKPVAVELRRVWEGDVDYADQMQTTLFDYRTTETAFSVPARDRIEFSATVTIHAGVNASQNRVNLAQPQ